MASNPELITFASREAMADRLADLIGGTLAHGVCEKGHATMAVSGGSTPKLLYEALAARQLDWGNTAIALVDERWVPLDHPRSNAAFVREAFSAAGKTQISGLYTGDATPGDGAIRLTEQAGSSEQLFDVVVLGMGDDGHTASWFPHADGLDNALHTKDKICAITARQSKVTGDEVERITLSLSAIANARLIILMITGDGKRKAFDKASLDGPPKDMPVRAILRARPDMWVCWAP